jgi:hypothetical protein
MENKSMKESTKSQPVVVTTLHKGVFFGYAEIPKTTKPIKSMRLTNAQMCIYWSADVKGVLGLASDGPTSNCKIGPIVPAITLSEITAIIEVSQQAEIAWQKQPWN